ncbi:MAG: outer membrane beta-barrel protein [Bacteroidia bacterium]|nr:outer membrane beta-barrel protein [Bacteroidia bacterium]
MNTLNISIGKTTKIIFTVIAATGICISSMAQKNIHFGLKAVPSVYWLTSADDSTKNGGSLFGFSYGAMLEFGLTDNYYIVTGLDVVAAGAKTKKDVTAGSFTASSTTTSHIQYLQLPVFLKMKTNEIGMIKYFGQFGLGTGIALSTKNSWTTTIGTVTTSGSDTKKDNLFPIRESLLIGAGLEYNLSGNTSLVGFVTFDNGFTNLLKNKDSNGKTNPVLKSKGVSFTIGILF